MTIMAARSASWRGARMATRPSRRARARITGPTDPSSRARTGRRREPPAFHVPRHTRRSRCSLRWPWRHCPLTPNHPIAPLMARHPTRPIGRPDVSATGIAAAGVFAVAMVVYLRTLLPGSSFGDWGEMQMIPAQLGVPHPTGYPLYVLLGKAFSLLPMGSIAYRANLLSAVAAAGGAAAVVLVSTRLGVRPVLAAIAGLTLAVTGTLWLEATFSEMNGLHLLLVALVIHRALVWRAERRDSDLRLGGLLAGLSLANHLLAVTVIPIVVLFVLVDARRRLIERPVLLVQAMLLFLVGVALYLFIPLRAMAGPPEIYGSLQTWDGVSSLITGAQFRGDMHFGSGDSLGTAWRALPGVVGQIVPEALVTALATRLGSRAPWAAVAQVVLVVLPVAVAMGNWASRDQSANHV